MAKTSTKMTDFGIKTFERPKGKRSVKRKKKRGKNEQDPVGAIKKLSRQKGPKIKAPWPGLKTPSHLEGNSTGKGN